jgi:PPM family protein phosphatase
MKFITLTKTGKRNQNEDYIYPVSNTDNKEQNVFIVCDGVGGATKGEIASKVACEVISKYFDNNIKSSASSQVDIDNAIMDAEVALSNSIKSNPENKGMATTVALLHIHNKGITIAHVGDSRIYHIRNGEILFQTSDHSFVSELVASGYITEKEALVHPKRNVITRAVKNSNEHTKADMKVIKETKKGDYFLICSDGVLEGIDNTFLKKYFTLQKTIELIIQEIDRICSVKSNDNYSAIIIQL